MLELFIFGTFWFWAFVAIEIILLFMFVEYENGWGATASLFIFAACLQWMGDVDIVGFVTASPLKVCAIAAAYFALGAMWGVCKWWIFVRDRLELYEEAKAEFLKDKGLPASTKVVPIEHRSRWQNVAEMAGPCYGDRDLTKAPRARDNKSKILRWMGFWWVSIIWSFCNDFVKRGFQAIYNRISGFLQRISDNMFAKANVAEDLTIPGDDD